MLTGCLSAAPQRFITVQTAFATSPASKNRSMPILAACPPKYGRVPGSSVAELSPHALFCPLGSSVARGKNTSLWLARSTGLTNLRQASSIYLRYYAFDYQSDSVRCENRLALCFFTRVLAFTVRLVFCFNRACSRDLLRTGFIAAPCRGFRSRFAVTAPDRFRCVPSTSCAGSTPA